MTSARGILESVIAQLQEVIDQLPADSPEVPDRVYQWPYEDEHLRRDFWKEPNGDVWRWVPSEEMWQAWSHEYREWGFRTSSLAWMSCTFTRTTDPSLPRTLDTLDDVPEDVERVTGDYLGMHREFARSGLSESGWFQRLEAGPLGGWDDPFSGWTELSIDRTKYVTNIKEDR